MRALLCSEYGPPENLTVRDVPSPEAGPGQVVIDVKASALNFPDALMVQGLYQVKPPLPFSPGAEVAGLIKELGEGVQGLKVGDRVIGFPGTGGFAEECVVAAEKIMPLPENMDYASGAALVLTYGTSLHALADCGRLQAGETLLVLGAAGGVGAAAVEIGKAMGARVIAAASTAEKLAVARERGADEVVNYTTEKLTERVMALTGDRGADVCFDPVGGELFDAALSSLGWGGRILLVGFVGGVPQIPANRLLVKHRAALGSSLRYFRWHAPERLQRSVEALLDWYRAGRLRPLVSHRLPLGRSVEAIKLLTGRRAHGKVVVVPDGR